MNTKTNTVCLFICLKTKNIHQEDRKALKYPGQPCCLHAGGFQDVTRQIPEQPKLSANLALTEVRQDGPQRSLPQEIFYDSLFPMLLNNLEIIDSIGNVRPGNLIVRTLSQLVFFSMPSGSRDYINHELLVSVLHILLQRHSKTYVFDQQFAYTFSYSTG